MCPLCTKYYIDPSPITVNTRSTAMAHKVRADLPFLSPHRLPHYLPGLFCSPTHWPYYYSSSPIPQHNPFKCLHMLVLYLCTKCSHPWPHFPQIFNEMSPTLDIFLNVYPTLPTHPKPPLLALFFSRCHFLPSIIDR